MIANVLTPATDCQERQFAGTEQLEMGGRIFTILLRGVALLFTILSVISWYASNFVARSSNRSDAEVKIAMYDVLAIAFIAPPAVWFAIDFIRWYRQSQRKMFRIENGLCTACGYNLAGNTSGVCPECGTLIQVKQNGVT